MAFVTDYVRLYALYHEGGIYMDTDVLVKKSFDSLLQYGCFTAIEYHPEMIETDTEAKTGKNGADCYSKNGHAVTVLTVQS